MTSGSHASEQRLPPAGAGFRWEETALLADTNRALAVFTTRVGGDCPAPYDSLNVSFVAGPDPKPAGWGDLIAANRDRAQQAISSAGPWSTVTQVHGSVTVRSSSKTRRGGDRPEADALWTDDPRHTIAIMVADCIPVLLVASGKVAVAHAGWRGITQGIIGSAAESVGADEVWIGPGIGPCCYTVGPDVAARFQVTGPTVDLWAAAERAAVAAGVSKIHTARICTSCHPDLFFSHRRDRGATGRQALIARLAETAA